MTRKELEKQEKSFRAELKRVQKLKAWYVKCKKEAEKRHDAEEVEIRQKCIQNFEQNEQMLLNIIDGIQKQKSGDVYFTKNAETRYIKRSGA